MRRRLIVKKRWYERGFMSPRDDESFYRAKEYLKPLSAPDRPRVSQVNLARAIFIKEVKYV